MVNKVCKNCFIFNEEIIRGYCRKCYYALKYCGEISNLDKPKIDSLTKIQEELLIGSLLGDAWLGRNKTSKHCHLKIERSVKDLNYLKYEFKILKNLCKSNIKIYPRNDGGANCYFISRSYEILDYYHNKWYKDKIKIVPKDLKLTPLIIAIWLADDGNISLHHKKQGLLRSNFATNGFTLNEVEFLSNLLQQRYKENFKVNKTSINNQYVINAGDAATRIMIKDIINSFPKSMYRKLVGEGYNLQK